ncbi:hypothetical protein [Frigidibacter sp. ROC022]|uniref:hypothetical protein n=1 Tax=Frigidibacter sp. ROC022 TaxID=2971796 RepID=UPI00215A86BE|nr:hypothetical protein [Frigidibacter sp. ROC022]MCR8722756.1 hypothetical protein [Frigidibacter sp. ROC022]
MTACKGCVAWHFEDIGHRVAGALAQPAETSDESATTKQIVNWSGPIVVPGPFQRLAPAMKSAGQRTVGIELRQFLQRRAYAIEAGPDPGEYGAKLDRTPNLEH